MTAAARSYISPERFVRSRRRPRSRSISAAMRAWSMCCGVGNVADMSATVACWPVEAGPDIPPMRLVIVGAGFGGIAAAIELRRHGFDDVTILERGPGIGGT